LDIEKFNEQVKTEIIRETPITVKELQVHRCLAGYDGSNFNVEGTVENTGREPLEDVQLEVLYYDKDGNLAVAKRVPMHPEAIAFGETVDFQLNITVEEKFSYYNFRFVLPSDEKIPYSVSWPHILGKLLVHWVTAGHDGLRAEFQGSVENTVQAPLKDVQVQMFFFDDDDNLMRTEIATLSPETIAVGERAKFRLSFTTTQAKIIKLYNYIFILPSGQPIPFEVKEK